MTTIVVTAMEEGNTVDDVFVDDVSKIEAQKVPRVIGFQFWEISVDGYFLQYSWLYDFSVFRSLGTKIYVCRPVLVLS